VAELKRQRALLEEMVYLGPEVPLVILVQSGFCNVLLKLWRGAIQDWDLALIIGKTSFGKGSVQDDFPFRS
jgi:carboxyl-terminal processing protease